MSINLKLVFCYDALSYFVDFLLIPADMMEKLLVCSLFQGGT